MSNRNEHQTSERGRQAPVSGEIYHNGNWVRVEDCQQPIDQQNQTPPQSGGAWRYDDTGRQVWSDNNDQGY